MRDLKKQNDRIKESYDRFTATFPKGKKDYYREVAKEHGMSLNQLINKLINDWICEQICNEPEQDDNQ